MSCNPPYGLVHTALDSWSFNGQEHSSAYSVFSRQKDTRTIDFEKDAPPTFKDRRGWWLRTWSQHARTCNSVGLTGMVPSIQPRRGGLLDISLHVAAARSRYISPHDHASQWRIASCPGRYLAPLSVPRVVRSSSVSSCSLAPPHGSNSSKSNPQ